MAGRRAGTWGDVGVLSFGGSKLLTAGRGGAILTPHADVFQRARLAQNRGNVVCPLSELQAAALLPQLDRLDERNARRRAAVAHLDETLREVPGLTRFRNRADGEAGYYKVGYRFDETAFGTSRAKFVAAGARGGHRVRRGLSRPARRPLTESLPSSRNADRSRPGARRLRRAAPSRPAWLGGGLGAGGERGAEDRTRNVNGRLDHARVQRRDRAP